MFERNRIDNVEQNSVGVEIEATGGDVHSGRVMIAIGRTLADVLNSPGCFIEFEPWGGERVFMSKSTVRAIKLTQAPRAESLKGRLNALDGFDPYTILGVANDATYDDVKSAWHRLSKLYHPDRYAAADLPTEVTDYLAAMARRINAAYAALEGSLASRQKSPAVRAAPIFTSRPRA